MGALSGSREPSPAVSALAGFDPERGRGMFPLNGFAPGDYMGTCHSCGQTVYDIAKRSVRCFPCAIADLRDYHERVERALRIRIWNEGKSRGLSDRAAMQAIHDQLHAIATEARRAETAQTGSVHDSAGRNGIAQPPSGDS
jgi:hypothetical protein